MTKRQQRRIALFVWVIGQYEHGFFEKRILGPHFLTESLTCESLPHEQVPLRYRIALTEFRHLSHESRVRACRRFLDTHPVPVLPNIKPKRGRPR